VPGAVPIIDPQKGYVAFVVPSRGVSPRFSRADTARLRFGEDDITFLRLNSQGRKPLGTRMIGTPPGAPEGRHSAGDVKRRMARG